MFDHEISSPARALPPARQSYVFVVLAVIFTSLLISAGLRSTPGVLLMPLQDAFRWSRGSVSATAAIGIFLYGLMGPFAAALMQKVGIRRTLLAALCLMAVGTGISALMTQEWQYLLTWGVMTGLGTGCVAMVLGATVVNRWFVARRGLMMGILAASTATGALLFLPVLAKMEQVFGWRGVVLCVSAACALLMPLVAWLLPERPADIGLLPFGADAHYVPPAPIPGHPVAIALMTLRDAAHVRDFWLLFLTFFVCGFTTNGLIGTHFISICADHGIEAVPAAGLLATMGVFDLFGTTASGWLSDRLDSRKLLFAYYGLRGISLVFLAFSSFSTESLMVFGVFYGLDWIATVSPTLRLTNAAFGERAAPIVFGWVVCGHQIGAACAAFLAGVMREQSGSYDRPLVMAGMLGLLAAIMALGIGRGMARHSVPES